MYATKIKKRIGKINSVDCLEQYYGHLAISDDRNRLLNCLGASSTA